MDLNTLKNAPEVEKKRGDIEIMFAALENELDILKEQMAVLNRCLDPILAPYPVNGADQPESKAKEMSPIAMMLAADIKKISFINDVLCTTIKRIDL